MEDIIGVMSEMWEYFLSFDPRVWIGVFSAFITFMFEMRLCHKGILFPPIDKKIALAKKLGHAIRATQISCYYYYDPNDDRFSNRYYIAHYEFQVYGKRKKKRIASAGVPPAVIPLYYVHSPSKMLSEYDGSARRSEILLYIFPIVVAYVVMKLLGYQG